MKLVKILFGGILAIGVAAPSVIAGLVLGLVYYSFKCGAFVAKMTISNSLDVAIANTLSKVK